jgi:prolyl-tRNA synthetase
LPILINQWANVVRWELRTRMFLRTTEFLWQEGHTAHATAEEAREETMKMLHVYADFAENYMAMPVIRGEKTAGERFPGAVSTYSIEAMMQDRKALQAGTSHFLGQNFAKAQEIKFLAQNNTEQYAWTTSWGVSTRLIGGLIMTHSDDDGLVLPPRLAPKHVVLLPIYRNDEERAQVLPYVQSLKQELEAQRYDDLPIRVMIDDRDLRGGEKSWQHVKKGVPIRCEIGPKDIAKNGVFLARRDTGTKQGLERSQFVQQISAMLQEMQDNLFARALAHREANTKTIDTLDDFNAFFASDAEISGGFALAPFADTPESNEYLKAKKLTVRCIPLNQPEEPSKCLFTGQATNQRAVIARAY